MEKILNSYLRRLTNLSGNNRSLLLLKLLADHFIDLNELGPDSFSIINGLIAKEKKIKLAENIDPRDADMNVMGRKLKRLNRIDRFIFQERGAKDLYVGWPMAKGKFSDNTLVRCPLIFFPVSI